MSRKNSDKIIERREQSIPAAQSDDLEHAITALHQTIIKLNKMIDKVSAQEAAKKASPPAHSTPRVLH